jgi:hypothetical protein
MEKDKLIRISNLIGLISIAALVYWVLIFITISVFGLKVFRENITETFYLSIIGILALMFGALMINIMLNMTKISDYVSRNSDSNLKNKKGFITKWIFILSFPFVIGLLFMGDYISVHKKERIIQKAADYIAQTYNNKIDELLNYNFSLKYIMTSNEIIDFLSKADESVHSLDIVIQDTVDGESVFLLVGNIYIGDKGLGKKIDYIYKCSKAEKDYLTKVFNSGFSNKRFDSKNGNYELFFPIKSKGKSIVLKYSEYQRYGKIRS